MAANGTAALTGVRKWDIFGPMTDSDPAPKRTKRIMAVLVQVVMAAYFYPLLFFAPYYNWTYAREHGFSSWLAFGEIVATAKALAWPYFALWSDSEANPQWTEDELRGIRHMLASFDAQQKAVRLANQGGPLTSLSVQEYTEMVKSLREALRHAGLVTEETLARVHPSMPHQFRDVFQKALDLKVRNLTQKNGDFVGEIQGNALMDSWADWHNANSARFRFPGEQSGSGILSEPVAESENSRSLDESAVDWPELTVEELNVVSEIGSKAMVARLSDEDIERYVATLKSYHQRVGRTMLPWEADAFSMLTTKALDYQYEFGRCLLMSYDSRQPFESKQLIELRQQIAGLRSLTKLETDQREIVAAANQLPFEDEFGAKIQPPDRDSILAGLSELEIARKNMKLLKNAILQATQRR